MVAERRFFWGKNGKAGTPMRKLFKTEAKSGMASPTIWDDVGLNQHAAREIELIFGEKAAFDTPKPEGLMKRIIEISTNPRDIVLDSFLGSGTTAAVAHKMRRKWIGIEMGEQAETLCRERLVKVVDGEQGGISKDTEWQGGGGFQFYKLGPKVFDDQGRINPDIKFEHLAAHVWFAETGSARSTRAMKSPLLGAHNSVAFYLLYNGILGDASLSGGNMLTLKVLAALPKHAGPKVIFGAGTNLTKDRLRSLNITFKQTPYDIRAR